MQRKLSRKYDRHECNFRFFIVVVFAHCIKLTHHYINSPGFDLHYFVVCRVLTTGWMHSSVPRSSKWPHRGSGTFTISWGQGSTKQSELISQGCSGKVQTHNGRNMSSIITLLTSHVLPLELISQESKLMMVV